MPQTSTSGECVSDLLWHVTLRVNFESSLLAQVDIESHAVRDGGYHLEVGDLLQPLQTLEAVTSKISDIWPEPPLGHFLHVFVRLPGNASEHFLFLVLGPF